MTTPEDFGIPPEVLSQAEATQRQIGPFLAAIQPVLDIIESQRDTLEMARRSREEAMRAQLPPQTRQQLADLVHRLPAQSLQAVAHAGTVTVSVQPEQAVIALLPQTPEEAEEVGRGVAEIEADPELRGKLQQVVSEIDWAALRREVRTWTPWAVLAWLADRLFQEANWPVTQQHLSAEQIAALGNRFLVLAILVALAQIIITINRRDRD